MKKNKDIEVAVAEKSKNAKGQAAEVHELTIGKKVIGEIEKLEERKFVVNIEGEGPKYVKSFDEGYEVLISHWNLFQ
ncbi:DUF2969 family protein [Vagococcus intermedius]|uniref:DUF2969 domain-containing protein n=1 Tax=Vagococcus intermedius TaxID=2991418 RepID=A0AAF0CWD6_9ENTE|nr:DUF2969 family protein [Vagococcus intermedius]WEG74104.1 DUF2969 domain-containing protein [Vagococcus intermedius]WEG76184.1 DUF2969 domain-containing protein [Vagococcus intermedius]